MVKLSLLPGRDFKTLHRQERLCRTSSARSKVAWNSWNTRADCSVAGTYAQPPFRTTFRFSTKSGMRVHLTWFSIGQSWGARRRPKSLYTLRNPPKFVFPSWPPISRLSCFCNAIPSSCVICTGNTSVARSRGEILTHPRPIELHGFQELLSLPRVVRIVPHTEQRGLGLDEPSSELLAVRFRRSATLQY